MEQEKFTFFWHGIFSQWHPCQFTIDRTVYNCAEQYMMASKARLFNDKKALVKIMGLKEPRDQKAAGRDVQGFNEKIWNAHAKKIVFIGSYAKFTQNENEKKGLLQTTGTTLVEASPRDRIWGIGLGADNPKAQDRSTWRGTNWLGENLTDLRKFLEYQQLLTKKDFTK